ncbi:methyltransferase domain-containing protein [Actinoplanes sp. NPDC051633]|uniref:methyltransferase domain-containing protein n=1 Tax=Actinoplanes sp. NPDC051633 TaxID=3155670 RepID=UPI00342D5CF0
MTAYIDNAGAWQASWDRQQEEYLPDREQRFAAMLDAVATVTDGRPPRLLDLAGGTGTISLRTLARWPDATATVLDQDPVLLTIARSTLRDRATVIAADLNDPAWTTSLPRGDYDAVLTATALHWLPEQRLTTLFEEILGVLRPGGVFINADQMPDDAIPELSKRLLAREDARREARQSAGTALSWQGWWDRVRETEAFRTQIAERDLIYPPGRTTHTEWLPPASWHVEALRAAGFTEAGTLWRGGVDAAVVGVR